MGEFIDEASGCAVNSRSRAVGLQLLDHGHDPATRPIPDSWIAALLLPVIIGCALFAATSQ